MIGNIIKIVVLGIIGFAGLVYLTAPKDKIKPQVKIDKSSLSIAKFPSHLELVNEAMYIRKEKIFNKEKEKFLIVLNHDALIVFNELDKYTKKDVLLVANIANTPWLIKKLAVDGKLEELYKNSKIRIANDSNGAIVSVLGVNDITQNKYFIYKVLKDGSIKKVLVSSVKLDALQKGISKEEKEQALKKIALELK